MIEPVHVPARFIGASLVVLMAGLQGDEPAAAMVTALGDRGRRSGQTRVIDAVHQSFALRYALRAGPVGQAMSRPGNVARSTWDLGQPGKGDGHASSDGQGHIDMSRIVEVRVDVLKTPVSASYSAAQNRVDANWQVLARVRTESGVEGFGYIVQPRGELIGTIASASRELAAALVGMPVSRPEAIWAQMARRADWVGPGGLLHWAMTPLDIAVWDAAGRLQGQALFRMLGGYAERVPAYASDRLWYSLPVDVLQASVAEHARAGFRAVKLRLSHTAGAAEQAERVAAACDAAGDGVEVWVDATEGWSATRAMQIGPALQAAGARWLEDPVHHENLTALAELARSLQIPVTGGEHYYTLDQFRRCFQARALDVVILDLARVGGITPWRRIAALAQAFQVPVCGHVVPEVHVHLLAATPVGHQVEYMPRSAEILVDMPVPRDGEMAPIDAPGHGLELDLDAVERYRVE
ncbi:MAG: mandelate racemase/muconate lactonizing enzyme family protein [Gammaproteobacteria bacterium]|nr:mandelate racemase/muconate lactonizing enzyme family protein [Gammaproteobacteria bacterium]